MNIFKKLFGRKKDGPTITGREYNPDHKPDEGSYERHDDKPTDKH